MNKLKLINTLSFALIGGGALVSIPLTITSCTNRGNKSWSTYVVGWQFKISRNFFPDTSSIGYIFSELVDWFPDSYKELNKENFSNLCQQTLDDILNRLSSFGDFIINLPHRKLVNIKQKNYCEIYKTVIKDNDKLLTNYFTNLPPHIQNTIWSLWYKYKYCPYDEMSTRIKFEQTQIPFITIFIDSVFKGVSEAIANMSDNEFQTFIELPAMQKVSFANYLAHSPFDNDTISGLLMSDVYADRWDKDIYEKLYSKSDSAKQHQYLYSNDIWNQLHKGDILLFGNFSTNMDKVQPDHVAIYTGIKDDIPEHIGTDIHTTIEAWYYGVEYSSIDDSSINNYLNDGYRLFIFRYKNLSNSQADSIVNFLQRQTTTDNHVGALYLLPFFYLNSKDGDFSFNCSSLASAAYSSQGIDINDYYWNCTEHLTGFPGPMPQNIFRFAINNPNLCEIILDPRAT